MNTTLSITQRLCARFPLSFCGSLLVLFLALLTAGVATAQFNSAQSGEYTDTTTWVGGIVPTIGGAADTADIQSGHVVTVTSGTAGVDDRLRIGVDAGAGGTFTIQGGTFIAAGNGTNATLVGVNGGRTGTLNLTSGLGSFNSQSFRLGANEASNLGVVNVSGGTLAQNGGEFVVGDVGSGLLNVTGGLLDLQNNLIVGASSTNAIANISAGKVVVDRILSVGNGAGSVAAMTISGTGVVNVGEAGNDGLGGGFNVIRVGTNATATGVINLAGGSLVSLDANQSIRVGENGDGTINISGGVLSGQGNLLLGTNQGPIGDPSRGAIVQTGGLVDLATPNALDGGGSRDEGDHLYVGLSGQGYYDITGGTIEIDSQFDGQASADDLTDRVIFVAQRGGSYGSMHIGGTAFVHASDLRVGQGSDTDNQNDAGSNNNARAIGVVTMSGGVAVFDSPGNDVTGDGTALYIGSQDDSSGTYTQTGGRMILHGDLLVGNQGAVTLHTNPAAGGGNGATRFGSVFGAAEGFFDITGGTLDVGNGSGGGDHIIMGVSGLAVGNIGGSAVVNVDNNLILGQLNDSISTDTGGAGIGTGNLTISGSAYVNGNTMQLGDRGVGIFSQSGGTLELRNSLVMGDSGTNINAALTVVAGTGLANITSGLLDIGDQLVLGDGNQGATGGVDYQDSRDALGSMNVGGNALVLLNTNSSDLVNDDSHTEVGLNGTGFLTISGGTLLTNHAGAIGTNAADGDGGEDETDLRLGVTSALNDNAASALAGTKVANTASSAPFGQVEVSAGALIVARDLNAGLGSFATGNVIVSGGRLAVDGDIRLADGNDSRSASSISGGLVDTGMAARTSGSNDGGALIVADGERSSAYLDVSGGVVTVASELFVGNAADSAGTLDVSGTAVIKMGEAGDDGAGAGFQEMFIGNNATSSGVINLSGGSLVGYDVNGPIYVGVNGDGAINMSGGDLSTQGSLTLAQNQGPIGDPATGTVVQTGGVVDLATGVALDGGGIRDEGDDLNIGLQGRGFYDITGGTIELDSTYNFQNGPDDASNRQIRLAQRAGSYGTMHIGGTAFVHANELTVGEGDGTDAQDAAGRNNGGRAIGVITVSGGTAVFDGTGGNQSVGDGTALFIGEQDDSSGTFIQTGGHVVLNGDIIVANQGAVTLHTNPAAGGGNGVTRFGSVFGAAEGFFDITGGTLDVGNGSGSDDSFIVGQRGLGTGRIGGTAVVNIDNQFILGNVGDSIGTDTGGAGNGTGVVTVGGSAKVVVGQILAVANAADTVSTFNVEDNAVVNVGEAGSDGIGGGFNAIRLGVNATSSGVINLSGGSLVLLDNDQWIRVGENGEGTINVSGGELSGQGNLMLGVNAGPIGDPSSGTVVQTGGVVDLASPKALDGGGTIDGGDHLYVGFQGRGAYDITGGTLEIDSQFDNQPGGGPDDATDRVIFIAQVGGSYGTMHIGGTALVHANDIRVGQGSNTDNQDDVGRNNSARAIGELTVSGGSAVFDSPGNDVTGDNAAMYIGNQDDSSGTYTQTGGHVVLNGDIIVANQGAVTLHTDPAAGGGNGGTRFGSVFGAAEGFFDITGGTLDVGNGSGSDDSFFVGFRGLGTGHIGGTAVVNIDDRLILGEVFDTIGTDTGGAGSGVGVVTIDGGAVVTVGADTATNDTIVGNGNETVGILNVGGNAVLDTDQLLVGNGSGTDNIDQIAAARTTGVVNVSGGSTIARNTDSTSLLIGNNDDTTGTYNQTGGHVVLNGGILMANIGTIILHTVPEAGGGNGATRFASVFGAAEGFFNMTGGTIDVGNGGNDDDDFIVGQRGAAVANIGGTAVVNIGRNLTLGNVADGIGTDGGGAGTGNGSVTIGGSAVVNVGVDLADSPGNVLIGSARNTDDGPDGGATGDVTVEGSGTLAVRGDIIAGNENGTQGTLNVAAGATVTADQLLVGSGNGTDNVPQLTPNRTIGVVNVSGGLSSFSNAGSTLVIGNQDDTSGTYNQTGGHVVLDGDVIVASIGAIELHTIPEAGGGNGATRFASVFGAAEGFFDITGGTLDVGNNSDGDDNFFVGSRGLGTGHIGGSAVVNIDDHLILGDIFDTIGTDSGGQGTGQGIVTIDGNAVVTVGAALADTDSDIRIQDANNGESTLTVGGNAVVSTDQIFVGNGDFYDNVDTIAANYARGILNVTGGSVTARNAGSSMVIGNYDDSSGTYNQSGGHVALNGDIIVADAGAIELHTIPQAGGGNGATRFASVFGASEGFFDITGGTLDVGNGSGGDDNFIIGQRGLGTGHIGGTARVIIDSELRLGNVSDSIGTDTGGAGNGTGILTIDGNAVVNVGERGEDGAGGGFNSIILGAGADNTGVINLAGGSLSQLDTNQEIRIGNTGDGTINISGGVLSNQGNIMLGREQGPNGDPSSGTVVQTGGVVNLADPVGLDGGGTINEGDNLYVGFQGRGAYDITGGTIELDSQFNNQPGGGADDNSDRQIYIAQRLGSYGTMHIGGTSLVHANEIRVGQGSNTDNQDDAGLNNGGARATGVLTVSGGSAVFDSAGDQNTGSGVAMYIGTQDDSSGTFNQSGGHVVLNGDLVIANQGAVELHTDPTAAAGNGATRFAAVFGAAEGFFNVTGGTLDVGNGSGSEDNFIVGSRGLGTGHIGGSAVVNIDDHLILGDIFDTIGTDTGGEGAGAGIVTIDGSAVVTVGADTATADIRIADANNTQSILTIGGSAVVSADQLLVAIGDGADNVDTVAANRARGVMNVSGGTVTARNTGSTSLLIGDQDDTSGTYTQSGGHVVLNGGILMANTGAIELHTVATGGGGNGTTRFASIFGASEGFFNMTGGTLDVGNGGGDDDDFIVGQRGNAVANIGGTALVNIGRNLTLGNVADGIGTDTGGTGTGNGSVTIGGSAVVNVGVDLADSAGGVLIGSARNTDSGPDGGATGDLTVEGSATLTVRDDIYVGDQNGTNGRLTVADSAVVTGDQLRIANANFTDNVSEGAPNRTIGVATVSGGLSSFSQTGETMYIGNQDDSSGTYIQSGGRVMLNGDLVIANQGAVELHTDPAVGGGNGATRFASIFGAAEGFFDISGGTLDVGDGDLGDHLFVGRRGLGTGHIHGDAVVNISGNLYLGHLTDAIGTDAGGAGTGQGIVTISGVASPTVNVGDNIIISDQNGNNLDNILNIQGGLVDVEDEIHIANGDGRKGTLNVSGGTTLIENRLLVGGGNETSAATYNQTGGLVQIGTPGGAVGTFHIDDDVDPDRDTAVISGGRFQPRDANQNIHLNAGPSNDLVISGGTLDMRHGSLIDESPGANGSSNNDLILSGGGLLNTAGGSVEADLEMSGGVFDMSADGLNFGVTSFSSGGDQALAPGLGTAQRDVTATGGTVVFTLTGDAPGAANPVGTDANGIQANDISFNASTTIKISVDLFTLTTFDIGDQWDLLSWLNNDGDAGSFNGGGTFDFSMAGGAAIWNTSLWGSDGIIELAALADVFSFEKWSNLPAWTGGTFAPPLPVNVDGNNAGDDVNNFTKYAFNMDPTIETVQVLTPGAGTIGLPNVTYGVNDKIKIEYIRRKNTKVFDITYTVEFSTDLENWSAATEPEAVSGAGPDFDRVIVEDSEDANSETRRFVRVNLLYDPTP